jgi:hypothetical protein
MEYLIEPTEEEIEFLQVRHKYTLWLTFNWETFGAALNRRAVAVVGSQEPLHVPYPPLPPHRKPLYLALGTEGTPTAEYPLDPESLAVVSQLTTGACSATLMWSGKLSRNFPHDYYRQAWRLPCGYRDGQIPVHPIHDRTFNTDEWLKIVETNNLASYLESLRPGPDSGSWRFDRSLWKAIPTGPPGDIVRVIDFSQYTPTGEPAARPVWADKVKR